MYDYLTELHQPPVEANEDQQQDDINIPDGSISVLNSPYDNQQGKVIHEEQSQQRHTSRSLFNCTCNRTNSGENVHQTKTRSRQRNRICTLS